MLSGQFSHLQQQHLSHHPSQHQPPNSAGLPPPSFNSHPSFAQGNSNSGLTPFAPSGNGNGLAGAFGGSSGGNGGGTGLASHAAVMGFAHGAAIQQQQQAREAMRRSSGTGKSQVKNRIRDVWQGNLAQEMQILREMVEKYPYISMVSLIQRKRSSMTPMYKILIRSQGYRVSRNRRTPDGTIYQSCRLSLPNSPLQRRSSSSDSAWHNSVFRRWRATSSSPVRSYGYQRIWIPE